MSQNNADDTLFNNFPPITTNEWEDKIYEDLKGGDYPQKLRWKTIEGFYVKPYYRKEDLKNLEYLNTLPNEFPYARSNRDYKNDWSIRQNIHVADIKKANKKALDILMKGVNSLGFIIGTETDFGKNEIEQLCENIYADSVELNFISYNNSLKIVQGMEELVEKYNRDHQRIFGSVDFDPIGQFVLKGKFPESSTAESFDLAKRMIETAQNLPNFKVITINGKYFHNSGSSITEELAFSLAQGVNYLTQLTDRGLSIDEVATRLRFQFATGSNYFMEIAKLRAARVLWAHIVKAYGPSKEEFTRMNIHSTNSEWNKTVYDPYVNMLRTTTESMSSIIGGSDSLTVNPFNIAFESPTELSERNARNQQLLLKEESYFDKIIDPAAGSYYIENLTDLVAGRSWELFLKVQEKGGFLEAFKTGYIQEIINNTANNRNEAIATRKEILLGTNQYPDYEEVIESDLDDDIFRKAEATSKDTVVETLKPYRGSQNYELLRYQTDKFAIKNKRPKVFLLTTGNQVMRRSRALFATNFFACAGYEIIDTNGFKSVEDGVNACIESNADIAVICSSDAEYAEFVPRFFELLDEKTILVVAGYPKEIVDELRKKGIKHFIHAKSNVLESLKAFQKELGII